MSEASFWNRTLSRAMSFYAILIFVVLWVGFAVALTVDREWLDILWDSVRRLPVVAEVFVWVALLPIMVGLWVWESSWPAIARIVGLAGIVGWTLLAVSSLRYWGKGSV